MPPVTPTDARRLATRLRFRHLQLLLALEAGGSLRAAAQALNFTQPALSKALGEIESAFGSELFTRTARGLTPTARGQVALRGARLLLEELAHVQGEVASGELGLTVVRVGAPPFVAHGYLPPVLARLTAGEPKVRVELMEERVPLLLQALADGAVDALVTSYPAQMPEALSAKLRYEKLFDAEFSVIAPVGHPLAKSKRVDWATLAQHDWIMPARTSMLRRVLEEGFVRAGVAPPLPVLESTSPVTNVQLVAAGIGWSVAPGTTVKQAVSMGLVAKVRVAPAITPGPVALIYRVGPANPRLDLLRAALELPKLRRLRLSSA
jgi:DNA-binding transcriptional LysR family regulator